MRHKTMIRGLLTALVGAFLLGLPTLAKTEINADSAFRTTVFHLIPCEGETVAFDVVRRVKTTSKESPDGSSEFSTLTNDQGAGQATDGTVYHFSCTEFESSSIAAGGRPAVTTSERCMIGKSPGGDPGFQLYHKVVQTLWPDGSTTITVTGSPHIICID